MAANAVCFEMDGVVVETDPDEHTEETDAERVALIDGFRDLYGTLRDEGWSIALVASVPQQWMETVCDRFDLEFDAVVSAEEIDGPGKPEPDVYRHAAEQLGIASIDCIAVETTTPGVQSATGAGMTCVAYQPEGGNLYLSAAERVVSSPQELRAELLD